MCKRNMCVDEYTTVPLEWSIFQSRETVAFTNGIRDHPILLSIVNEGFNEVDIKNDVC